MTRSVKLLLLVLFAVAFAAPIVAYWWVIGRAPSVTPEEARRELATDPAGAMLVDIRLPAAFAQEHVASATNWPWEEVRRAASARDLPAALQGKRLLLLCQNGIRSGPAARHLQSIGALDVRAVRDGMCGWISAGKATCQLLLRAPGGSSPPPERVSPRREQYAALLSGFVIKPLHMLLALGLVTWLWRATSPDLTALRWSLTAFLAGETACAVNYLVLGHQSHLGEYLHSAGMAASFGLAAFAAFTAADLRLVHYQEESYPCALAALCGPCAKHVASPCGVQRLFLAGAGALLLVTLMPLSYQPQATCYTTTLFGVPYAYSHPVIYQLFETRFCPTYALLFVGGAFVTLLLRGRGGLALAEVLLAAGAGALGFGMLRLFLFAAFQDHLVWSVFWEELLELLTVLGAAWVLWVFRSRLFALPIVRVDRP